MIERSRERVCDIMKTSESLKVIHPGRSRTVVFDQRQCIWKEDQRTESRGKNKYPFFGAHGVSESRFRMPTSAVYVPTFISGNLDFADAPLYFPPRLFGTTQRYSRWDTKKILGTASWMLLFCISSRECLTWLGSFFADRRQGFKLIVYSISDVCSNWMHNLHRTSWRDMR